MNVVLLLLIAVQSATIFAADDTDLVREAALGWTQAAVKQDAAALQRFLADDLQYAHAGGQIQTKAQYIAAVTSGPTVTSRWPGQDSRVRTLQVNHGQWQIAAHQSTRAGR